jgi:uncharacterized protein (DUF1810 family)
VTPDPFDLARFVAAQDAHGTYDRARAELVRGRKTSHWMWFVFPQLAGLGHSAMSRKYAIASLDEAQAYVAHRVLSARLVDCAALVAAAAPGPVAILGSVDALKLQSSMTLFRRAAPDEPVFTQVLEHHFAGRPDAATDALLGR